MKDTSVKIKVKDGFLYLTNSEGDDLGYQKDMIIKNSFEDKGFVYATVTFKIKTDDIFTDK